MAVTRSIKAIDTEQPAGPQQLQDVVDQWGSSFNFIHASAAFAKAAKLRYLEPMSAAGRALLQSLAGTWTRVLPESDLQGMADVLWASSKLQYADEQLWSSTLAAFVEQLQQGRQEDSSCQEVSNVMYALASAAAANRGQVPGVPRPEVEAVMSQLLARMRVFVTHPRLEGVEPQQISNALWGCAKLRITTDDAAVNSLLQAMARPQMLEAAAPQAISNTLWAVMELQQHCGWQPRVELRVWQRLLGEQQLGRVADKDTPQGVSNALLALAWLATPAASTKAAALSLEFAQDCAQPLLQGQVAARLERWMPRQVANAMWACAKVGVLDMPFLDKAAASASQWLPFANAGDVRQVAIACKMLRFKRHADVMAQAVLRSDGLLHQHSRGNLSARNIADNVGLVAVVSHAVAALDMET